MGCINSVVEVGWFDKLTTNGIRWTVRHPFVLSLSKDPAANNKGVDLLRPLLGSCTQVANIENDLSNVLGMSILRNLAHNLIEPTRACVNPYLEAKNGSIH